MSEVICNVMVCLDAVSLRLLPLHLYFFLLVLICFFCGRTALSISVIIILALVLLCRTTVNPRGSGARLLHFCDVN